MHSLNRFLGVEVWLALAAGAVLVFAGGARAQEAIGAPPATTAEPAAAVGAPEADVPAAPEAPPGAAEAEPPAEELIPLGTEREAGGLETI